MVNTAPLIIRGDAGAGATPAPADRLAAIRPRYREFEVAVRGREPVPYAGYSVTLEDVIDDQAERLGHELPDGPGPAGKPPESFEEDFPDRVVWDRGRVVAVLRPRPDGNLAVVFGPDRAGGPR